MANNPFTVAKFVNSEFEAAFVVQVGGFVNTPPAAVKLPNSVAFPEFRIRNSWAVVVVVNILRKSNAGKVAVWIAVPLSNTVSPNPFVRFHPIYPVEVAVGSPPARLAS